MLTTLFLEFRIEPICAELDRVVGARTSSVTTEIVEQRSQVGRERHVAVVSDSRDLLVILECEGVDHRIESVAGS